MKILQKAPDGGAGSGVDGYFLVEIKPAFSVVLLRFSPGTREAFHSHAFNALTIWLRGSVLEHDVDPDVMPKRFCAGRIKFTPRARFHKVEALATTWALSFRGPWVDRWLEKRGDRIVQLTHGRVLVGGVAQ